MREELERYLTDCGEDVEEMEGEIDNWLDGIKS
jgi:hypothetical protein